MVDHHTAKAFDVDLQDLARMVAEMGGLAEKQIAESVDALARRDANLAQRVVALDPTIDALQREIEERAILTIARRQPMAVDLREVVGALRLSNDLERIGDLAKNIAKRVLAISGRFQPQKIVAGVQHMSDLCEAQLKDDYTIAIVTHNMQQAARVSDYTAFMYLGELIEFGDTSKIFTSPDDRRTQDYITGRFG